MTVLKLLKPTVRLYDNQKEKIPKLCGRRRVLLTDKTGSGKTLSILYSYMYLKEKGKLKNLFVLTPLAAYKQKVWVQNVKKFTYLKIIDIEDLNKQVNGDLPRLIKILDQYDVIYGKHSHVKQIFALVKYIASLEDSMLVVDEVHAFRNQTSALTIKFKMAVQKTNNFWGLTATPLAKNLEDTYNIVNLISPWFFGAFTQFRDNYCTTRLKIIGRGPNGGLRKVVEITGIKNEDVFAAKLEPLVIQGDSFVNVNFHYIDYKPSPEEQRIYKRVANGIGMNEEMSSEDWINAVFEKPEEDLEARQIKSVERHSSRFIYLQTAADGVLTKTGSQDNDKSVKIDLLLDRIEKIVSLGESTTVYFDFHASLQAVKSALIKRNLKIRILISSGKNVLKEGDVTEAKVKYIPYIILSTRAGAESVSYYFINNCIFFHVPTVPHIFAQFVGRITRKDSLFLDNLHCWIFRSENIDLYKLIVISAKSYQMEIVSGREGNIPPDYKQIVSKRDIIQESKKLLLWQN